MQMDRSEYAAGEHQRLHETRYFQSENRAVGRFSCGSFTNWIVSLDGKYVLLATAATEPVLQRLRIADHHMDTITKLEKFTRVVNLGWTQLRVAPDGSPTFTRSLDSSEIYALTLK